MVSTSRDVLLRLLGLSMVAVALGACEGTWLGVNNDPPLVGQRISVLATEHKLKPSAELQGKIQLPKPRRNADWPQAGGFPPHAMHHIDLGASVSKLWLGNAGVGAVSRDRLLSSPIIGGGRAFVMDGEATVIAFDAKTGWRQWVRELSTDEDRGASLKSGGIAFDDGRIYATTGFGQVIALRAEDGEEVWRRSLWAPLRAAPTVSGDRVFVVTKDNELRVLSTTDGRELWTHTGIQEVASLLGSPSPAVDSGVVVVGYSSGELFALRVENGGVLWSDSLTTVRRSDPLSNMSDIRGRPVIDRGRVYSISHSGIMVAIDLRTGQRLWELEAGGTDQPWVAGDFLFVIGNESEIIAVEAKTGQVAWISQLPKWEDEEDHEGRIQWTGPVLAGDRLIATGSHGRVYSLSPYTGEILGTEEMPDGVSMAPIVADGMLYFLTNNGQLVAYGTVEPDR
ncbi:MAG: PQQ-like beta-propeller repeat protein [Alphaproteobacteria bacterium]